jgi:predicted dinucleotide-binding enzyme
MKIGILGAGSIGATLARKLSGAGHDVKVANSRGPETISSDIVASGARPVEARNAVTDVDVLITSMPLSRMPEVKTLITDLPANTVIIDTSNYYPLRDGRVEALEDGKVESVWITEQLGRPIAKAWNAITAGSFEAYGRESGDPNRIAIPVAADRDQDKAVAMALVEETGFDAVDAGSLADSWRQQPGAPSYCTDFTRQTLPEALAAADKTRLPQRRDIALAAITERFPDYSEVTAEYLVRLHRAIYS